MFPPWLFNKLYKGCCMLIPMLVYWAHNNKKTDSSME